MSDLDLRPPPEEPLRHEPATLRARGAPPRRPRRRVPALLALAVVVAALVLGIVIGFFARGESPPAGLVTEQREVPVVTVTVPATTPSP
jgi:ferric-dicitrate binding protein FerR (iron transport regulator)